MKRNFSIGVMILPVMAVLCGCQAKTESLTSYVDPRIGSGEHGHVFVGANVPFGMVQVGPSNVTNGWDWCSGYHESDTTIMGFSHTHLSGTGCGDLCDITVLPVVGDSLTYARGTVEDQNSGLWSYFSHDEEIVKPGYYSVPLKRYDVVAEMTATSRVGVHRYTFPASDKSAIVISLLDKIDRPTDVDFEVVSDSRVVGHRFSHGWADDQRVYFVVEFSKPFKNFETIVTDSMPLFGRADFNTTKGEQILMKVALSCVSTEGAVANLEAEVPGWNFDELVAAADRQWNDELGRVRIKTDDEKAKKIFYTSLYHAMVAPSEYCDVNGDYRGSHGKVVSNAPFKNHTTFSLWDTYRTEMPLLSIIQPERYADMVNSMVAICEEQGRLPVWHFWSNETDCMIGNPAIPVVADAIVKNIPGVDRERAYRSLLTTAGDSIRGYALLNKYGYIPYDLKGESVAYGLEYALADWAVAQAAKAMGDNENAKFYEERSHSYRKYFDPAIGFIRPKLSNGEWVEPYSPYNTSNSTSGFCEGNGWQYTWLVPHDVKGLRDCFGSDERMIAKLDSLFVAPSQLDGEDVPPDVSGLIGQYAHGNEPGHHTVYMYAMLGRPEKTADLVRRILAEMYSDRPEGICGNEDVGQMSAWYVMSAMGFYEVEPGSGRYWFGTPLFDEIEIDVPDGVFKIVAHNNSDANRYVKSVRLNGKEYKEPFIDYAEIMKGGILEFEMTSEK